MTVNNDNEKKAVHVLWRAFFHLLCENPADSISVQRVCDEAGYHRTTFYKHYKDVFGLYIYFADIVSKRVIRVVELYLRGDLSYAKEIDALIEEYKKPFFNIVNARYTKKMHYIMSMVLERRLGQYISQTGRWSGGGVPAELLVRYTIGGFYELAFVWIENICKISDQQFSLQVQEMLRMQIGALFLPAAPNTGQAPSSEQN